MNTQTPTTGAAPEVDHGRGQRSPGAAGTAPDPSGPGHGYAGPGARPQVSPSRSLLTGKDGERGASDAPAAPPVTSAPCDHQQFTALVEVTRLSQTDGGPVTGYAAAVRVSCADCSEPFQWMGLPVGLSPRIPMASVDGQELRAPLRPASAPPGFGEAGPSFSVTAVRP